MSTRTWQQRRYLDATLGGEQGRYMFDFAPARYFVQVKWVTVDTSGAQCVCSLEPEQEREAVKLAGWKFSKSKQWQRSWEAARR